MKPSEIISDYNKRLCTSTEAICFFCGSPKCAVSYGTDGKPEEYWLCYTCHSKKEILALVEAESNVEFRREEIQFMEEHEEVME